MSRRFFLKNTMGASLALAGLGACTRMPAEKMIPYLEEPSGLTPGVPAFYASTFLLGGYGKGVVVESHEARPTKIEGNKLHPGSLGATDVFMQASVLSLYDPDRSKAVMHLGAASDWSAFEAALAAQRKAWQRSGGEGVRILTETVTSPALGEGLRRFLGKFPKAKWHQYEPLNQSMVRRGAELAFGRDFRPIYHFEKAEVVVSFAGDFLGPGAAQLPYARAFMARRRPEQKAGEAGPNRLYAIESNLTITGACADHRIVARPSEVFAFALAVARELGLRGMSREVLAGAEKLSDSLLTSARLIAAELRSHPSRCLVVAGEREEPELQALAFAMNEFLRNRGRTVHYIDPPEVSPVDQFRSLRELVDDMSAGKTSALFILGGNPAYCSPRDLGFGAALEKVPFRARLGLYEDETSLRCHWHLPETHFLEAWGDARAFDGTVGIQQPLLMPLYDGKSALEVVAQLGGEAGLSGFQLLRSRWARQRSWKAGFEARFTAAVRDGVIANTAFAAKQPRLTTEWLKSLRWPEAQGFEAVLAPDPTLWDGAFANNAWLQELPKPITQLTWDNVALLGAATAKKLGLEDGDVVRFKNGDYSVEAPIYVLTGHAEQATTLFFGYGRSRAGHVADSRGYNAYALQKSSSPFRSAGISLEKTAEKMALATTQTHHKMEGRELVVRGTFAGFERNAEALVPSGLRNPQPSLIPAIEYAGEAWAMVIDLSVCIGCKACMIACQAENNIPVVGKDQVLASRELHWIRVDSYFEGDPNNPKTFFQPVPCMHCERAPCEYVCPTAATNHSSDGLNQMVYNRCVGTRYCSNNCPYKVRRFNFFAYAEESGATPALSRNPDVTVRSRGVMEKCTYCVQRIQEARIDAEKEGRPLRDGEVVTACQAACPTSAIVFGDKNDKASQVRKLRESKRNYSLLAELGTQPRTTYLAKLENPNPAFAHGSGQEVE